MGYGGKASVCRAMILFDELLLFNNTFFLVHGGLNSFVVPYHEQHWQFYRMAFICIFLVS